MKTTHGKAFCDTTSSVVILVPIFGRCFNRFNDNLSLATRQDDPQWSKYVHWTAASLVSAESLGITQRFSSQMPIVNLFGLPLNRTFRDAVHAVGNHAQLYERTVAKYIPRKDRNLLNSINNPGPLLYFLPGFEEQATGTASLGDCQRLC